MKRSQKRALVGLGISSALLAGLIYVVYRYSPGIAGCVDPSRQLNVYVTNGSGGPPVVGTLVTLSNGQSQYTNSQGLAQWCALAPGDYTATAEGVSSPFTIPSGGYSISVDIT